MQFIRYDDTLSIAAHVQVCGNLICKRMCAVDKNIHQLVHTKNCHDMKYEASINTRLVLIVVLSYCEF